jgi:glyoxylase-like metal-dependent hydrolase (beta-lactamase superfamily II)
MFNYSREILNEEDLDVNCHCYHEGSLMILRQFLHSSPIAASYLFGCGGRSAGAVVDPLGAIAPYLEAAEATGMRIRYVIDTHVHADHVASARELATAAGAEYVLFAEADVGFRDPCAAAL